MHQEAVRRDTHLSRAAHLRHRNLACGEVHRGVVKHNVRRVTAELQADARGVLGGLRSELLPHLRRAGEGELAQARIIQQIRNH